MTPDDIKNTIALFAALVAAIGVFFAVRTYYLNRSKAIANTEGSRPNFAFIGFGFERPNVAHTLSSSPVLLDPTAAKISGTLTNIGKRPAKNVRVLVQVIRQIAPEGNKWATIPFPSSIADDIQPSSEWL